jgi:hypothetical protein
VVILAVSAWLLFGRTKLAAAPQAAAPAASAAAAAERADETAAAKAASAAKVAEAATAAQAAAQAAAARAGGAGSKPPRKRVEMRVLYGTTTVNQTRAGCIIAFAGVFGQTWAFSACFAAFRFSLPHGWQLALRLGALT